MFNYCGRICSLYCLVFVVSFLLFVNGTMTIKTPEDATLGCAALGRKYGQRVEEYDVTTEDKYVLKLYNFPGNKSRPVLLMHGVLDAAKTFVVRGYSSLSVTLVEKGFDVWLANTRGVLESRRHAHLKPDTDEAFWDYSFHEIGYFDLPAIIDYILNKNNVSSLSAIGHSQGNMIFYVLGSTRPEYNNKIDILVALGPVCYLNNLESILKVLIESGPKIKWFLELLNENEIFSNTSIAKNFISNVCYVQYIGYEFCSKILFSGAGYDAVEFDEAMLHVALGHYPTSISRRNAEHLLQVARGNEFLQFNYGTIRNNELYKTATPPSYNLSLVHMKVALFVGKNDRLTPIEDVNKLSNALPNVVEMKILDYENFNHIDFVWGRHMGQYLFPYVIDVLNKYN